jgi:hypothetical protein
MLELDFSDFTADGTNIIERSFDLSNPTGWHMIGNCPSGVQSWTGSVDRAWERVFFRIRTEQ